MIICARLSMYIIGACLVLASCAKHPVPVVEKVNGQPTAIADVGRDDGLAFDNLVYSPKIPVIYFDFNSDQIRPAHAEDLSYALMATTAQWACQVDGYASEEGSAEYNLSLGDRRARAVGAIMTTFQGVAVSVTSYGEARPAATPELSRRVEIRCR